MTSICIGIPVHTAPARLHTTLTALKAHTESAYDLLLLPDGPDAGMREALAGLPALAQSGTAEPRGDAACFNRLVTESRADIVVLLEAGAVVGPGWLDHLLAVLEADERNGIAGPSTNLAWNQQCVRPHSAGAIAEVRKTAQEVASRYGKETRTLEPLYSLADFCYAVSRKVVDTIGAADEGYGLGPCWEMDFNIRAARAGWRAVWVCAAYVQRPPFTARRRFEEARRFEASKRHYQNRFCGARLRGEKTDYRLHCRGDDCANFAPSQLIALRYPVPESSCRSTSSVKETGSSADLSSSSDFQAPDPPEPVIRVVRDAVPLVSCIMPTHNRRCFVSHAIRCFLRQDYSACELIIIDDGTDAVASCIPEQERIRYIRLEHKLTIGEKRNLACEHARGEYIVHWDDDDWYPPWRVSTQMRVLLEQAVDLCGSSQLLFYDGNTDQGWEYRYTGPGAAWVAGTTMAYQKSLWERTKFADLQIGEDCHFVWSGESKKVTDLANPNLCVASVHPGNTSRKETKGNYWYPDARSRIYELLKDEIYLYRSAQLSSQANAFPLVSCIMPTYNRRAFVGITMRNFANQDYPRKELVIVDDGKDPLDDLLQSVPDVRYIRLRQRASIGAKRNIACQHARGEIIAHWDDDDWYAADRLRYQVAPIMMNLADVTGLENAFVLVLSTGEFWTTQPELHRRMFMGDVHGGTLVYRKSILSGGLRYPEINLAEDAWLLDRLVRDGRRLVRLANPGLFVYVRHGQNAWRECIPGRFLDPAGWRRIDAPPMTSSAVWDSYKAAATSVC